MKKVSKTVCGPLLQELCEQLKYEDSACVELFRKGTSLWCFLVAFSCACVCSPSGAALFGYQEGGVEGTTTSMTGESSAVEFVADRSKCWHSNVELLESLREDGNSHALHKLAKQDHELGRMSLPVPVEQVDLCNARLLLFAFVYCGLRLLLFCRLVPRFGVEQGLKPDGSVKIRAVDHMSWSASQGQKRKRSRKQIKEQSINGHCELPAKVSHDHLDGMLQLLRVVFALTGAVPWLWKADIDAAFRRVPLMGAHIWASGVAYLVDNVAWCSFHYGMPFGATSSVWAWHRVGAMIAFLARKLLHLPVLRYVDDYFSADRKELVEHAMQCFARLTRLLLGHTSVSDRKLDFGASLLVLGIVVEPALNGIRFILSAEKAQKYREVICRALQSGYLSCGESVKLAGKLMFATQHLFNRVGRALIKPVYAQKSSRNGVISPRLRDALQWWLRILTLAICELRDWEQVDRGVCHLFVDAASSPARCAAVLFHCDGIAYTDAAPNAAMWNLLMNRRDKQITGLEIWAIALGLSTFQRQIMGRTVFLYSDNTGM